MTAPSLRLVRLPALPGDPGWSLSPDKEYGLGRSSGGATPDVDLAPDPLVSREHARLWFEEGWKVRDVGSRHGTRVGGESLEPGQDARFSVGDVLQLGESRLVLVEETASCLQDGPVLLECEPAQTTGYVLHACRQSPFATLRVRNTSPEPVDVDSASISVEGLGTFDLPIGTLAGLASVDLRDVPLSSLGGSLQTQTEREWRETSIEMNGSKDRVSRLGTWYLAANEWSYEPSWWPALASFALPNHAAVLRLANEVSARSLSDDPTHLLEALYASLAEDWTIEYRLEAPHYETDSQKIRLPDQVLWDANTRRGGGTCLDLALLMASALECMGAQPLIAVVDAGPHRHALVGCWNGTAPRLEPVLVEAERLLRRATWIDPNGVTQDETARRTLEDSRAWASILLLDKPLHFAVDLVAARQDGYLPMPLTGEPQLGPDAADAIAAAHGVAQSTGAPVGTVPLLIGLLRRAGGFTRELLGHDVEQAEALAASLVAGLRPGRTDTKATRRYFEVLSAAHVRAKSSGLGIVTEANLLAALMHVESQALDSALSWLGHDRGELRERLRELPAGEGDEASVFDAPSVRPARTPDS